MDESDLDRLDAMISSALRTLSPARAKPVQASLDAFRKLRAECRRYETERAVWSPPGYLDERPEIARAAGRVS